MRRRAFERLRPAGRGGDGVREAVRRRRRRRRRRGRGGGEKGGGIWKRRQRWERVRLYLHRELSPAENLAPYALSQRRDKKGTLPPLPSAAAAADMYRAAVRVLGDAGYEHYETSSYAKGGKRSRHNERYWGLRGEWLAAGLGATSCLGGKRVSRPREHSRYLEWVDRGGWRDDDGDDDNEDGEGGGDEEVLIDFLTTGLRRKEGIDIRLIEEEFGAEAVNAILRGSEQFLERGLAVREGSSMRLSDPDGFLFSDYITRQIIYEIT